MLKLTNGEDGSLTIVSDDRNAENVMVADAFGDTQFEKPWNDAPFGDTLELTVPREDASAALELLAGEFPVEVEEAEAERQQKGFSD